MVDKEMATLLRFSYFYWANTSPKITGKNACLLFLFRCLFILIIIVEFFVTEVTQMPCTFFPLMCKVIFFFLINEVLI